MQLRAHDLIFQDLSAKTAFMRAALALANYRVGDDDLHRKVNSFFQSLRMSTEAGSLPTTNPSVGAIQQALAHGQQIRDALERFTTGRETDLQALREVRNAGIARVTVSFTGLDLLENGEHFQRITNGPADSMLAVALLLLLDPKLSFGQNLRRCQFSECGRFFIAPKRRGGRIPAYCPDMNCQRLQDTLRARRRAKEYRAQRYLREQVKPK